MNILNNSYMDLHISLQQKLCKWLACIGSASWKEIQNVCRNLLAAQPDEYITLYGSYPEYKIFMPLLRNGICEISKEENKTKFVYLNYNNAETLNPLLLLNNFPSIDRIIKNFEIEESILLRFYCDLSDKYTYKLLNEKKLNVGIYKTDDRVYYPSFIFDAKDIRRIPDYNENIDSINIARCFVRNTYGHKLFTYNETKKELHTYTYSELPILITRALILFDKTQLQDKNYLYPLNKDVPYHNIDKTAINELIRIFGEKTIEVKK